MKINSDIRKQIENLDEFIHRWNTKAEGYKDSNRDLSAVFDEFVTRYIVFNALYKICAQIFNEKRDRNSATYVIDKFLADNNSITQELSIGIDNLRNGILNGPFRINNKAGSDEKLVKDLQQHRILALLQCIYQIRCNLLHGDKEFVRRQEMLLAPATHCLEIINNAVYQKLVTL